MIGRGRLAVDFALAWRSLLQHGRRTVFLGGALAAVTALLVLLTGLSAGVRDTMLETATTISTGHVNVGGFYKFTGSQSAPVVTDYPKVLEVTRQHLPELAYAVQRGRGWAKAVSDTGASMQMGVSGIDIRAEPRFAQTLHIVSGRLDDLAAPGTILIFENHAEKLGVRVGDGLTLSAPTTRGINNTLDVRVVAIAKSVGLLSMFNTFIPNESLRALYRFNDRTTGALHLMLKAEALPQAGAIAARLRRDLEGAGYRMMAPDPQPFWMKFQRVSREEWTGQKLDVTTWEDELGFMSRTLSALNALTGVLITILLAIIVTGIMNTMWIAIRERTREIGTLRAIGMQRPGVLWMFLLESLLLGIVGTVTGAVLGAAIAVGLNALHIPVPLSVQLFLMSDQLRLAIHPDQLVRAVVLITAITGVAALLPALRAARLRPVVAMQHFG